MILVTLDTTRVDRIGAYGYAGANTPAFDALAAEGVRFDRAYAVVPLTTPAHASMLSGLYPQRHGIHTNGDAILSDEVATLAELLGAEGYATAASVSAFVTTRVWNLDQGFDAYLDDIPTDTTNKWRQERPASEVVDDALAWLDTVPADTPFFLWVHFYDPHAPHEPPKEWAEKLPGRPYDAEIAYMDAQIGRLRAAAEPRATGGLAWIAVADHGEALNGEHGEHTHGNFLYDETMHIPMVVRPPTALATPVVVDQVAVSNVDVMPTALGLLGVDVPQGLDGVDLSPTASGATLTRSPVFMESYTVTQRFGWHPEFAVADGQLKLMDTPSRRLFDVVEDPKERTNLAPDRPADVTRLHGTTETTLASAVVAAEPDLAPEVQAQLEALGYMGAGNVLDTTEFSDTDAKDKLNVLRAAARASELSGSPETADQAEAAWLAVLALEPDLKEASIGLAKVYRHQGRLDEAELLLRAALDADPGGTVLHFNMAELYMRTNRPELALLEYEAVLAQVPGDRAARSSTVRVTASMGRSEEALKRAEAWLAETPDDASLCATTGLVYLNEGNPGRARPLLECSLGDGIHRPGVNLALGRMALNDGDQDLAFSYLHGELEVNPNNLDAHRAIAGLLMSRDAWEEAATEYSFVADADPTDLAARVAHAQATFNLGDYDGAEALVTLALDVDPELPEGLMLLANIYAKTDRMDEGKALADRANDLRERQVEAQATP
jgi:arylsulfatase A-like enzyme/Tfp pilus assembly protein PilF